MRMPLIGLLAVATAACGQSSGAAPPSLAPVSTGTVKPITLLSRLLPRTIADATFEKARVEKLKDQLAPPGTPGGPAANRRVKATWLTSKEAVFRITSAPGVIFLVDMNLYRSAHAARSVYHDWMVLRLPHIRIAREPTPAGASPGSGYFCEAAAARGISGCVLMWRQGAVLTHIFILGKGTTVPSRVVAARLAPRLRNVQVQVANRIVRELHVLPGS
jgi:hypothetical protein